MASPHLNWPQNIKWLTDSGIIRDAFNTCQYYERAKTGELASTIFKCKHRSPPTEPNCTHSQLLIYWDGDGNPVAMVHQYLRPDGTIGGSGWPDPKRVVVGETLLALRTAQ